MSHDKSANCSRNAPEATVSTPWPPSHTHCNPCSRIAGVAPHSSYVPLSNPQQPHRTSSGRNIVEFLKGFWVNCCFVLALLAQYTLDMRPGVIWTCVVYYWHMIWCWLAQYTLHMRPDVIWTCVLYHWHMIWCWLAQYTLQIGPAVSWTCAA